MSQTISNLFPQTRRMESQRDNVTAGQALLERAGFIRSSGAAGIYTLMPLGFRTHEKIKAVIYDEMERAGVQNMQLPVLQSRELWQATGRWSQYVDADIMFTTSEPHGGTEFGLAPTAEEIVTATVAADLRSFRQLPLILHQIGPKFRAELRPRMGMLRAREFEMSDAYSFDRDEEQMRASFDRMREVYSRIFTRLGIDDVISVKADSGAIGGSGSAEFMVLSEVGEDTLLTCGSCDYGANREKADSVYPPALADLDEPEGEMRMVATPGVSTIAELCHEFPDITPQQIVKTLLYVDKSSEFGDLIAVCIRGDLEVQEVKLANVVGSSLEPASPQQIEKATGARVGFAGPVNLRGVARVLYDKSVAGLRNFVTGANRNGMHLLNVNFGRDVAAPMRFHNVHAAAGGHGCPECSGTLTERRGIEVGHVFQLQLRYEALGARFMNEVGEKEQCWMGCYGIGTTRVMQAIAELHHDEHGLVWPPTIAPYDVHVVLTNPDRSSAQRLLEEIEAHLDDRGITALVDDRPSRPGEKFAAADLIGCPARITIGRGTDRGMVEIRHRGDGAVSEVTANDTGERLAG